MLVLDDLGAEKTSEWVEETLNLIVNTRYSERRTTVFTSNYEDKGDDTTDPDSLLFRIGFRMRSRLHEMCELLDLDGADYRELPPNGGVDDLVTLWKLRTKASRKTTLPSRVGRTGARADRASATGRPTSSGRAAGRQLTARLSSERARALPPHSVLLGHLQLLQLQPRPVRRRPEGAVRPRAARPRSGAAATDAPADTIFFGGGTPSLLEPGEIAALIDACRQSFALAPDAEITLEANPETVTPERLAGFRAAGVNRLSYGVQSFRDDELARLSRLHSAARAARGVRHGARRGLRQHLARPDDVAAAADGAPSGSNRSTRSSRSAPTTPRCTCSRSIRTRRCATRWRAAAGRSRPMTMWRRCTCRVSTGWTRPATCSTRSPTSRGPGRESRHNLKYWTDGEWLGFGCGAHSTRGGARWKNCPPPRSTLRPSTLTARWRPSGASLTRGGAARRGAVHRAPAECRP